MLRRIRLYASAIIILPATFLHELAHALITIIFFGKVYSFSLSPKIKGNFDQYGEVVSSVPIKVFYLPIALAPLVWWAFLYFILTDTAIKVMIPAPLNWYLYFILAYAGKPSTVDVRVAFKTLISPSAMLFLFLPIFFYFILTKV